MKLYFLLLLCLPLSTVYAKKDTSGIRFEENLSLDQIKAKAKEENKFIFLDLYTTWCGPCKQMDREVYLNDSLGEFMNKRFISAKVQMDRTDRDNEVVKKGYKDARYLEESYQIAGYPSYLFFSPDGKLIYKAIGYKNVKEFLDLAKLVVDPKTQEVFANIEKYKNGERDYKNMLPLIKAARESLNDTKLADSIARDFKQNYFDKLSAEDQTTKENLAFINENSFLITSKDRFFQYMMKHPLKVDTAINFRGAANSIISYVINKEEIESRIWKDNKAVVKKPDWGKFKANISRKYNPEIADSLISTAKISFYGRIKDCEAYSKHVESLITRFPPKANGNKLSRMIGGIAIWGGDAWALNAAAWDVFKYCSNKQILRKALAWSKLSVQLEDNTSVIFQYYDTMGNLLYKLGEINDAIKVEERAIALAKADAMKNKISDSSAVEAYTENLLKMKNGQPTWGVPASDGK